MANRNAESALTEYLLQQSEDKMDLAEECFRMRCSECHASRHLYCPDCLKLMMDENRWPQSIRTGLLQLPFSLDIIFTDRRTSSTGIQIVTLLQTAAKKMQAIKKDVQEVDLIPKSSCVRLVDVESNDAIPNYQTDDCGDETFLLFPSSNSIPLSRVMETGQIKRLVLLDCKWRQSSIRLHPSLEALQNVHLDNPPQESFYWRWHNKGSGMLSTIEAVYYAAWQLLEGDENARMRLLDLFWLFAHQRKIIKQRYDTVLRNFPGPVPYTNDGKEYNRALRRQQKADVAMEMSQDT